MIGVDRAGMALAVDRRVSRPRARRLERERPPLSAEELRGMRGILSRFLTSSGLPLREAARVLNLSEATVCRLRKDTPEDPTELLLDVLGGVGDGDE